MLFAYVKSSSFTHVILRLEKFCQQKLKQSFEAKILLAEYGRPHKRETLQKGGKNGHVTSPIISWQSSWHKAATQNKGNKEINTKGAETKKKFTGSYPEVNPTEGGICAATKPEKKFKIFKSYVW